MKYATPFQLLVSVILSAQCTDTRVNAVTKVLFADHPDLESFLDLSQEDLESYIRSCGLHRSKARNILEASRILAEEYGGDLPDRRSELMKLPGVGRKTANVVLANVYQADTIAVDTHVYRVSRRLGLAGGRTPRAVEEDLMKILPREAWAPTHHRLIFHGRRVCKAIQPGCDKCSLRRWCDDYREREE